jgi:tRNA(fMet)-specific endonuclease VapC
MEEVLRGRLAALSGRLTGPQRIQRYAWLAGSVQSMQRFRVVPFDTAAEAEFQRLLASGVRVGTQDLKIAAVALAANLTVLTRNRDFGLVPGLTLDGWSV